MPSRDCGRVPCGLPDAKPTLILKFPNSVMEPLAAVGDLDGRPGEELILMIPGHGLVALGISPDARPIGAGTASSTKGPPAAGPPRSKGGRIVPQ